MSGPGPSRPPGLGAPAPEFVLPAAGGGTVRLREHPKPLALVFLRHLG